MLQPGADTARMQPSAKAMKRRHPRNIAARAVEVSGYLAAQGNREILNARRRAIGLSSHSYFFDFELLNHCVGCKIRLHTEGAGFFFLLATSTIGADGSAGPAVVPPPVRFAPLKSTSADESSCAGADGENMPAPNSGAPLKTTNMPVTRKRRKSDMVKILRDKLNLTINGH
jgi:hypothetical protein